MTKPIIGIVSKILTQERPSVYVSTEMSNAVIDNGGIPIAILPPDKGSHSIKT